MTFRRRIFLVVFLVGLIPSLTILALAAVILDSTIDRLGAVGLENSLRVSSQMIMENELAIGSLLKAVAQKRTPRNETARTREWMQENGIDLVYAASNGDWVEFVSGNIKDSSITEPPELPKAPGLSRIHIADDLFICYSIGDSSSFHGCGVKMPSGYESEGKALAEAVSVSASLGIYKGFSLQLLAVVTVTVIAIILILGFFVSTIISRQLVKPLKRLTEGAARIGRGDLEFRVALHGRDEFSRLGESFNRMAGEIRENQTRLLEAQRIAAWREVARRIAHEIRNPLTPITVELYRLQQGIIESKSPERRRQTESIEAIKNQISSLQDLASQFSLFAKEPEIKPVKCGIGDIIHDVVGIYGNYENVEIVAEIPQGLPELSLDPNMISRLFVNLLKNSIEASPEGVKITISVSKHKESVEIIVSDNGPGYPEDKLARIDQPYITTKGTGSGLGLVISKKIVEEHGGDITFYNDDGAVARIIFPLTDS